MGESTTQPSDRDSEGPLTYATTVPSVLHLWDAFGVEIEYMIVSRDALDVLPVADEVLRSPGGVVVSELEMGDINWSNELVLHVLELKTAAPATELPVLATRFHENVGEVNHRLEPLEAMLLPSGAHPFMDPDQDTRLWPHEHNQIYALYDRVFDCRGHGWSNLQSTHLNLPFADDEEFGRLHAAIRLILPLIPALAASTPMLDGRVSAYRDARLEAYRHNQSRIPSLGGMVIPERAFDQQQYHDLIFDPMLRDMRPFDTEGVLDRHFLNSRGAIARFDRGSIEIRLIDSQEAPVADIGIVELMVAVLKSLTEERWSTVSSQMAWHESRLAPLLHATIEDGEDAWITEREYLAAFGIRAAEMQAGEVWARVAEQVGDRLSLSAGRAIETILGRGTLSTRLLTALGTAPAPTRVVDVYRSLAHCLADNVQFTHAQVDEFLMT